MDWRCFEKDIVGVIDEGDQFYFFKNIQGNYNFYVPRLPMT
jgi:hypothetical protein